MNSDEVKAEIAARGFDYLEDTRLTQFALWAYQELTDTDLWATRIGAFNGAAPLSIGTDGAGTIASVFITSESPARQLTPASREWLEHVFGDLTQTGTPVYYYSDSVTSASAARNVNVYPAATPTLAVRLYQTPIQWPDDGFGGPGDLIYVPERFHRTIVDIAVRMAYRDADDHDAADRLQLQIDKDIDRMRMSLLVENAEGPDGYVQVTGVW